MIRPFKFFKQRGDLVVTASCTQTKRTRRYLERTPRRRPPFRSQAQLEQFVHDSFVRSAAAPHLRFHQRGNIIVNGQC